MNHAALYVAGVIGTKLELWHYLTIEPDEWKYMYGVLYSGTVHIPGPRGSWHVVMC